MTFEAGSHSPILTPDGKRVTFSNDRAGQRNLFWKAADGSGAEERLAESPNVQIAGAWSPDGKVLAFEENHPSFKWDIWVLSIDGVRKPRPFLQTPAEERHRRFSPDGRWLAYDSNESGRAEVYVQPFPGPGGKGQVSTEGGSEPVWARNGRELFYRNGSKMTAVAVSLQSGFTAATPRLLFEAPYAITAFGVSYDVSPDGQRFVMIKEAEQRSAVAHINLVLNWFEELKHDAPAGRR